MQIIKFIGFFRQNGQAHSSAQGTIYGAARTAAFFVSATRTIVFAFSQVIDGDNDESRNYQQHYGSSPVHAMTALAMR